MFGRRVGTLVVLLAGLLILAGCFSGDKSGGNVYVLSIKQDESKWGNPWKVLFSNKGKRSVPITLVFLSAYDADGNKIESDAPAPLGVITTCDDANVCKRTLAAGQTAHVYAFANRPGIVKMEVAISWGNFERTTGTFDVPHPK